MVLSEELLLGDASRSYFLCIRSPKESKTLKGWMLLSSCITVIFSFLLTIRAKYLLIVKEARYNLSVQEGILSRCWQLRSYELFLGGFSDFCYHIDSTWALLYYLSLTENFKMYSKDSSAQVWIILSGSLTNWDIKLTCISIAFDASTNRTQVGI